MAQIMSGETGLRMSNRPEASFILAQKYSGGSLPMAVTLKPITEDNFLDAFHLKLKKEQEEFV